MMRVVACLVLSLAVVGLSGWDLHAQDKKSNAGGPPIDSAKLAPGQFVGILKSTPGTDRLFTLEVETQQVVPARQQAGRPGGRGNRGRGGSPASRILQIQRQATQARQRALQARTPQQRVAAMQQLMRTQVQLQQAIAQAQRSGGLGAGYRVNTVRQTVDFQAAENVKVRTLVLPDQFDEKGNIKKFTPQELAQLKGKDSHLPGYESSLDKLEVGAPLRVVLARAKPQAKQNKDADDLDQLDKSMQVQSIVILGPPTRAAAPVARKPGKKAK